MRSVIETHGLRKSYGDREVLGGSTCESAKEKFSHSSVQTALERRRRSKS
jgi:hypothetical protein